MSINKKFKTAIQTIIFAIIGIALVYWRYNALSEIDKQAMFHAFAEINWWWLIPIIIISYFSHYFRALRWQQLLYSVDVPTKRSNAILAVLIGYLANLFVPRLGEIAKCTILAKYEHQPADKIIGTVIVERLFDMICFIFIFFITIALQYNYIAPYALKVWDTLASNFYQEDGSFHTLRISLLIIIGLVGIIGSLMIYKKYKNTKIGKIINGLAEGLKSILLVKHKGIFLFHSFMIWLLYTAVAVMVFKAMPSLAHLPLGAGLSIITFGSIAMMVPAPGGIAYPIIVAPVLVLYGVSEGMGQGYGWINWGIQNISIILLGLTAFILLPILNTNKNEQAEHIRK